MQQLYALPLHEFLSDDVKLLKVLDIADAAGFHSVEQLAIGVRIVATFHKGIKFQALQNLAEIVFILGQIVREELMAIMGKDLTPDLKLGIMNYWGQALLVSLLVLHEKFQKVWQLFRRWQSGR